MFSTLPHMPAVARPCVLPGKTGRLRVCVVGVDDGDSDSQEARCAGLRQAGHHVQFLGPAKISGLYAPTHSYLPLRSLRVYHWLARQDFDLVVFADDFGLGYYSFVARDLGLAFTGTTLAVLADTCLAFDLENNRQFPQGRTHIEQDFLESQSMARADALVSADPAFTRWAAAAGWRLPARDVGDMADIPGGGRQPGTRSELPFISVCLTTFNRPQMLEQAVQSLTRQTYGRFEVILVDDGSTDPGMATCLQRLAADFENRHWTILRQDNAGVAAARDRAIRAAKGDYVLLMDDDNLALAHELERFAQAAANSGADILTCIPGRHPQSDVGPDAVAQLPGSDPLHPLCGVDWTPVGHCLSLAAMVNCLGDCNALYRRSMMLELGGYGGERRSSFEDFTYLLRAVTQGYRLEVVPEILFLYRRHRQSRSMRDNLFFSHVDSLGPLAEMMPKELWPLLLMARRDWYGRHMQQAVTDDQG
mgnify:CR=1 FL=1